MPYFRLFYHLVWPTRNRDLLISSVFENELFSYISKKASELDCKVIEINGTEDHIHLVIEIPPKYSLSDVIKKIKGASSHEFKDLYWATGYGAFTVSERNLGAATEYVHNQKEHHKKNTIIKCYEMENEIEKRSIQSIREVGRDYEVGEDWF
ncbi:MAG: IS200/IS605 family transposase [Anaerolineaceae bacterium]|nr:IS200/IS605 family transposase [Anaerolineaceae bacterium]